MDPMTALAELDNIAGQAPLNRKEHAHLLVCVETIKKALAQGCPPVAETTSAGPILVP